MSLFVSMAACDARHWGVDCAEKCDCQDDDGSCDAVTGQCNCEAGYTGTQCHEGMSPQAKYLFVGCFFLGLHS